MFCFYGGVYTPVFRTRIRVRFYNSVFSIFSVAIIGQLFRLFRDIFVQLFQVIWFQL